MRRYWLIGLLLCAGLALAEDVPQFPAEVYSTPGPHVVVNGALLKAPTQEQGGSLLLPMRAVFEALEAKVLWFPATQQITAVRGATTVQLWINKTQAFVNDKSVALATPPTLFGAATYVPLRFPAEAFGGTVKWYAGVQTAVITITPLAAAAPVSTATGPLNGVLLAKNEAMGKTLLVQEAGSTEPTLVLLTSTAVITRGPAGKAAAAAFADLQPGDGIAAVRDDRGRATTVVATVAQVKGKLAAVANNKLLLQDGTLFELRADTKVVDTAGKVATLTGVAAGTEIVVTLVPGSTTVWSVTVPAPAAAPAPAPKPAATAKALKITAPADKAKIVSPLTVTGEATAGAAVRVTISYAFMAGSLGVGRTLKQVTVTAGDDGAWKTDAIDLSTIGKPDTYTVKADVLDANSVVKETVSATLVR
jgi:hypothetical protein